MSTNQTDTMKRPLIFDIETGTRHEVTANPEHWFKPDGRLTDVRKIALNLDAQAEGGALSPITGQVLAIGYSDGIEPGSDVWCNVVSTGTVTEADIISDFLQRAASRINVGCRVVGFNVLDFDIPFLLFRAQALGLTIPACIGSVWRGRWQANHLFTDLMLLAQFGNHDRKGYSLDRVCRALGIQGKNGSGAMFAELVRTDMDEALDYLTNDIRCTVELARKFI